MTSSTKPKLIRLFEQGGFNLRLLDTGARDKQDQTVLAYEFRDYGWDSWDASPIFSGSDFGGSPLTDDSDAAMASLLRFLSLRRDGFEDDRQRAWMRTRAGDLNIVALELKEQSALLLEETKALLLVLQWAEYGIGQEDALPSGHRAGREAVLLLSKKVSHLSSEWGED